MNYLIPQRYESTPDGHFAIVEMGKTEYWVDITEKIAELFMEADFFTVSSLLKIKGNTEAVE